MIPTAPGKFFLAQRAGSFAAYAATRIRGAMLDELRRPFQSQVLEGLTAKFTQKKR